MYEHPAGEVPGLRPHLVAHLAGGWRYASGASFVDEEGDERVDVGALLPEGSRVEPMVPELQRRAPEDEAEADLARYFNLVFPQGTDPEARLDDFRGLPCFDEVHPPPRISLPGGP